MLDMGILLRLVELNFQDQIRNAVVDAFAGKTFRQSTNVLCFCSILKSGAAISFPVKGFWHNDVRNVVIGKRLAPKPPVFDMGVKNFGATWNAASPVVYAAKL